MTRTRLPWHGLATGLLVGALAGVADAYTTPHAYLGRPFLAISVLAWCLCAVPTGAVAGALAGLVARGDSSAGSGLRAPATLAAALTAGGLVFATAFQVLVWLNVTQLAADTGREALLADLGVLVVAVVLSAIGMRILVSPMRRARPGLAAGLLVRPLGIALLVGATLGAAALAWRGGVGAVPAPTVATSADAPNVVLILLDTLRRDHLSGEGYARPTTPALDELAGRGARFPSLVSTSCYTKPAVASLLTSLYPSGHRVGHLRTVLSEDRVTLAEAFHAGGWRTAKFVSNTIIGPEFGFAQGTERFVTLPTELVPKTKLGYALFRLTEPGRETPGLVRIAALLRRLERRLGGGHGAGVLSLPAPEVIEAFERWQGTLGDDPFFAYLHFMEPHAPYRPPADVAERFAAPDEPFRAEHPSTIGLFLPFSHAAALPDAARRGMIRAYDAEIAGLDRALAPLLEELARPAANGRPTVVAVTSDHGEEFYEHGGWGHGQSLYGELLRVPFLLAGPGVPPGVLVDRPVQLVDIAPTLLELAGAPVPGEMAGRSLVGALRAAAAGAATDPEPRDELSEIVYGETYWARGLRSGRWKILVARLGEQESVQLFDVESDPDETHDLAAAEPDRTAAMRARLEARVAEASLPGGKGETAAFDPVTAERLKALGYVD